MRLRRAILAAVAIVVAAACAWGLAPSLRNDALARVAAAALDDNEVRAAALDDEGAADASVYLVVGSDRRDGAAGHEPGVLGERADAIMLWAVPPTGQVTALSLPRDVRVHVPGHGDSKLHGVLAYGPEALVAAVRALTGVPVHHYVEVEFSALTSVIDDLGGVRLTLPLPARDPATGLDLPAGSQVLDGQAALSYVRSRQYEELTAAGWSASAPGDLGRIDRQHLLLRGLLAAGSTQCSSLSCLGVIRGLGRSLTVDAGFDGGDVRHLVATLGRSGADVSMATLPTRPERGPDDFSSPFPPAHLGSLGFRVLDQPAAAVVLDRLLRDVTQASGDPP